jgi:ATP:ADP antiporter, AAA family
MGGLFDVRAGERRPVALAFAALLAITAAHTMLETARDALFLTRVPVTRLPILYVAIAALGLAVVRAGALFDGRADKGRARLDPVTVGLVGAALATVGFWALTASRSTAALYALYAYTGLFAAFVAGRLWIGLGDLFTVAQAKRVYGLIGTGAVLGAVLGAAAARAMLAIVPVRALLLVGAGVLLLAAIPSLQLARARADGPHHATARPAAPRPRASLGADMGHVARDAYLVRVLALALLASLSATFVDFIFKSEVVSRTPPEELGKLLATVSLALNAGALVAQLFVVGPSLRALGVHRALYVVPLLLALGASSVVAGLGLAAALALRAVDGTLKHSLHKTSTELLFVPLPDAVRARVKPIVDLVGQRGGQAVASVAILALTSIAGPRALGLAVVGLSLAWLVVAWQIRARYLDVFRRTLQEGHIDLDVDAPALDLNALEAIITALSSRKDAQVLGALDLLAAQRRAKLLPALILYHPSKAVVLRSLDLLVGERRTDIVPICDRLLAHADPEVRSAALRARVTVEPDDDFLRGLLSDPQDEVRAVALVALVSRDAMRGDEARSAIDALMTGTVSARRALCQAVVAGADARGAGRVRETLTSTVDALSRDEDAEVRAEAVAAIGVLGATALMPRLVDLMGGRVEAEPCILAFAAIGERAAPFVDRALGRTDLTREVRWRLVRALSRLPASVAVPVLQRHLIETTDGMMRYRILRALRTLQSEEGPLDLDAEALRGLAVRTMDAMTRAIGMRVLHAELRTTTPGAGATAAGELIEKLLTDKEAEGLERLMLVLGLLYPEESFARIRRGLASKSPKAQASSRELLENLLSGDIKARVLVLLDDAGDEARLSRLGAARTEETYPELLRAMVTQGGAIGTLASYHANELGIDVGEPVDADTADDTESPFATDLATLRRASARDLSQPAVSP